MRALRSSSVKNDRGSNKSDTEKATKKAKRNKKAKKTSKKKPEVSTDASTEILTEYETEHKITLTSNDSSNVAKPTRASRHSTKINKNSLKENISPNIKEKNNSETDVTEIKKKSKRKTRRNESRTKSLEFEDVITSTVMKPKKSIIRDSSEEQVPQNRNKTRSSKLKRSQNFVVVDVNESTTVNKTTSSLSSTFEKTYTSQEYSPTFKNIVTSTTIKPKKRKQNTEKPKSNTSNTPMESDVNDDKKSNILLQNEINTSKENATDVLNSTYVKIDDESISTTNNSGQWNIEQQQQEKSVINISGDTKMFESHLIEEIFPSPTDKDVKKVFFQDMSLSKSARKKWQRFPRNSQGANSVLEQISTPQKKSLPNKSLNISQKLNKTGNTTMTSTQSANKIKRTAMPNFALIHQKAYEKMESISEYSQRKKDRANLLLSNKKTQPNEPENKIKSSRQLFTNEKPDTSKLKFNRFGFKLKPNAIISKPLDLPQKPLKLLKPAISQREEIVAIANKKPQNTGKLRENKRDLLKGVRTNRRFELLMKMRNN